MKMSSAEIPSEGKGSNINLLLLDTRELAQGRVHKITLERGNVSIRVQSSATSKDIIERDLCKRFIWALISEEKTRADTSPLQPH